MKVISMNEYSLKEELFKTEENYLRWNTWLWGYIEEDVWSSLGTSEMNKEYVEEQLDHLRGDINYEDMFKELLEQGTDESNLKLNTEQYLFEHFKIGDPHDIQGV